MLSESDYPISPKQKDERPFKSLYKNVLFLLNFVLAAILLLTDSFLIISRWKIISPEKIKFAVFWIALVATLGPFIA
jgi:hypothetical protein